MAASSGRVQPPRFPRVAHRFNLSVSLVFLAASSATFATEPDQLSRDELLFYRDAGGRVQRVTMPNEWRKRRASIVQAMESIMGKLPGKEKQCPLDWQVDETTDCGSYVRYHGTYQSEPGCRVPAFLLVPKSALEKKQRAPAVLCLHPTDNRVGNRVVVGLGGRANRQYAQELAELGYVTLAPAYPLLADYQPDWRKMGYRSGTMKAIWDNIRAIDLLESLPYVKPVGVGAIGHSLGGHNSVYTAVFEPRIRVIVSSCGLDRYRDYKQGDIRGWTSDRYMPKLLEFRERLDRLPFDFPEVIAALAPRPCLIIAPLHDDNFRWKSVDRVADSARPVYRLLGGEKHLQVVHPDCAHDFPEPMRKLAYKWIGRVLNQESNR